MKATTENMVGKLLEPVFASLPDAARRIVDLEADEQLQQRVQELAQKADAGDLTPEERDEYKTYIETGDILVTLQALARRTLNCTIS